VLRKSLRSSQMQSFFEKLAPCLIGMEACAIAHYWARVLSQDSCRTNLNTAPAVGRLSK